MFILISDKISQNAIQKLKNAGFDVDYHPDISLADALQIISKYDGIVVRSRTKVSKEIIDVGKNLKVIGRVGSGIDNIDKEFADKKGIKILTTPDANSIAVSELTIALMICLLREIPRAAFSMKEGLWIKKELSRGSELHGKKVGIVGFGNIGKRVAEMLKVMGSEVLVFSRSYKNVQSIEELFSNSDIITIHLALTSETRGIVTKELLRKIKPTSYLLNLARSETVDQEALYDLLLEHSIAGAALDVFDHEPLSVDSPFRKLDNVILTPHIGASTIEAVEKASDMVAEQIIKFFK